ncbi:site-specific DNA-methyltransferase [Arthrobacter psychrochitiniphilus]|uniref:Site-specific DNA-methyltransferase n=1 Tax=Arthrobacter psychrochitiniphilus TaxID=291045 RepID=A0A2V3DMJ7_9MICC|nr:DNA methyltransferase [Arthrobacter psychrochitiniphilus]NYG15950.1 adenine-specific DNA-methyltransferase [Arthrobacter psychrochitiniphilus]PXA63987.1 site-specific DNA-methyltransferase [Arthrobacter psychrochitiniphilus]
MAHLDTLIERITDPRLRSEIQEQVTKLAAKTSFGLVFEEHRPESVVLPGFEVSRGGKVVFRDSATPGIWEVAKIEGDNARLVSRNDRSVRMVARLDELIVIREFGDSIYPGLKSTGKIERGGTKPFHTLINAENFHALQALLYGHRGKVDAIYVDPPYNTGAKDWKYNNDYVDGEDAYRHSKWLAFMERRLKIAKDLLKPSNSVLIVTIDEREVHRLALLLEQIFPSAKIQMVSVAIKPGGIARTSEFSRSDEHYFFVMFGSSGPKALPLDSAWIGGNGKTTMDTIRWRGLLRAGNNSSRTDRPTMFFPVFVLEDGSAIHSIGDPIPLTADRSTVTSPEGTIAVWPIRENDAEGRWQLGAEKTREAWADGFVRPGTKFHRRGMRIAYLAAGEQKKIHDGLITVVGRADDGSVILDETGYRPRFVPTTQWAIPAHSASEHGSRLLKSILPDRSFPFPKSLYAVEDALRFFVSDNPDAVVLDFFSGSGTTAHAVMRLNRRDGGRRRSISITNNEVSVDEQAELKRQGLQPGDAEWEKWGICEYITKPRISAAITGATPGGTPISGDYKFNDEFPISDGFDENVEFFELTYEDNQLVRLGQKFEAIAPILWMRAGSEGERIDELPEDGWIVPDAAYYGLLTDIDQWEPFVRAVNAREDIRSVFIVTDSQAEFEAINVQIDQHIDSVRLYSDYLQTFEINTRQG